METKSPTTSVRSREIIGVELFSQRREVFDKHDTVFLPPPSPSSPVPAYRDTEPIITSNHGKTTSNFKRNTPLYSSMQGSRTEERNIEFRARKYSDNFTSELNQSDEVDYRHTMTERTRRLSKLRRDFLNSNLHEPGSDSPFARTGLRASMPARSASVVKYKIESPNLYKFPFAEPYATPPPVRKILVDLGPVEVNGEKENQDPELKPRHLSLPNNDTTPKVDHQKFFEELVKRYSPQRKPINWNLPPTRPRVVGSVPKSFSSIADSVDSTEKHVSEENFTKSEDDDVFVRKENKTQQEQDSTEPSQEQESSVDGKPHQSSSQNVEEITKLTKEIVENGSDIAKEKLQQVTDSKKKETDSKSSLEELDEKNDEVPELSTVPRLSKEPSKKPSLEKYTDLTIPALIDKMTEEAEELEHKKDTKKIKRKRSFWDRLRGRNKKDK